MRGRWARAKTLSVVAVKSLEIQENLFVILEAESSMLMQTLLAMFAQGQSIFSSQFSGTIPFFQGLFEKQESR